MYSRLKAPVGLIDDTSLKVDRMFVSTRFLASHLVQLPSLAPIQVLQHVICDVTFCNGFR